MDWWAELFSQVNWPTVLTSGAVGLASVVMTNWLAWLRHKRSFRLHDRTEFILRRMLKDRDYRRRRFSVIKRFVPLPDDRLREALLRAGGVRLEFDDEDEIWGLLERHRRRVFRKGPTGR